MGVACGISKGGPRFYERSLDSDELARRLCSSGACDNNSVTILLDCRPASSFKDGHLKGALNANCPAILLRRMQKGERPRSFPPDISSSTLMKIVSTCSFSGHNINNQVRTVVLYDDGESTEGAGNHASVVNVLSSILEREIAEVFVLRGGYGAFKASYPQLCVATTTQPPCHRPFSSLSLSEFQPETFDSQATEVLPYLFLGNQRDSACLDILQRLGITHVLNVARECCHSRINRHQICYKNIPMEDIGSQNLLVGLEACFEFIEAARTMGGRVLVHCMAGVSRSAAVTLAYVMRDQGLSLSMAYQRLKSLRANIAPNLGFMGQLQEFERGEAKRCHETNKNGRGCPGPWAKQQCLSSVAPAHYVPAVPPVATAAGPWQEGEGWMHERLW